MSQKVIITILIAGSIFFILATIFLSYKNNFKPAYNPTQIALILTNYAQKNLASNMQSGLNLTDKNTLHVKENTVYAQWTPKKNVTVTLSVELSPQTNKSSRIFFSANNKPIILKGTPQEIDANVVSTIAQIYWISISNPAYWTCRQTQYTALCTAHLQTNSGKNEYAIKYIYSGDFNYQTLLAFSCFTPKENPQFLSKTPCLSQL